MKNTPISEEFIQPCWVCEKVWQRKDTNKYLYFNGILICKDHKYAQQWYNAVGHLSDKKFELEMVKERLKRRSK